MRERRRERLASDRASSVARIVKVLPEELRSTLVALHDAPIETVVAVFELLPFDQRDIAIALDLATEGEAVPGSTIRAITPSSLASDLIKVLAEETETVDDRSAGARGLAEHMAQRISEVPPGTTGNTAVVAVDSLQRLAQQVVARQSVEASLRGKVLAACLGVAGSVSVEEVARRTGLARALVSNAFARLSEHGFVSYDRAADNKGQRDAIPIHVNADQYCALGVKVLPGTLIGVVTDLRGEPIGDPVRRQLDTWIEPAEVVAAVGSLVRHMRQNSDQLPEYVIGLGVELGGHIDGLAGRVEYSHLGWQVPVDLGTQLRKETGLVTIVENDANALAVYEHLFGDAVGYPWFAAVLLGEGIGAGLVLDGHLAHGARGIAGELGHVPVDPGGPECRCGNRGCLEAIAGIGAILAGTQARASGGAKPETFADAVALAEHDDEARKVFLRAGDAFGVALSSLVNLLNLELVLVHAPPILVSAGAARLAFEAGYEDSLAKYSFSTSGTDCQIRLRPLSWPLGPLGAAAAVVQRFSARPLEWQVVRTASDERVTGDPAAFLAQTISFRAYAESEGDVVRASEEARKDPLGVLRLHSAGEHPA